MMMNVRKMCRRAFFVIAEQLINGSLRFCRMDTILEESQGLGRYGNSRRWVGNEAVGRLQPGDKVYCCIRPENVAIELRDPDDLTTARNVFPAKIVDIDSMGPFLKVTLDCGFPLVSFVTREAFASLGLDEGKTVFATFKATAVHLIQEVNRNFKSLQALIHLCRNILTGSELICKMAWWPSFCDQ
jgi:molybdopterin-binding protein